MPLITKQLSPIKGRQELLNKINILKTSITNKENISSEDMKSLIDLLISILNIGVFYLLFKLKSIC
jgi:hypothetical protein